MAFNDPIVGTEVLIRNQIQSENFSVDPIEGVSGWQIKRDGTATFNQLVIGGPKFVIDQNGNAVFNTITLTTDGLTQGAITLYGEDLDLVLNQHSHGTKALINLPTSTSTSAASTALLIGEIVIPAFSVTRQYEVGFQAMIDPGTATPSALDIIAYYQWDSAPAVDGTAPVLSRYLNRMPAGTGDSTAEWVFTFSNNNLTGTGTNLFLAFGLSASGLAGVRMLGTNYNRIWVKDVGLLLTGGSWTPGSGSPPPTQYTKTYSTTGTASYQSDGDKRTGIAESYQGEYSATNGNQFSWNLFPYSTIAADLAGSTINKVEVYLKNKHWYYNSGGTAVIGYHNSATLPDLATYPSTTDNITQSTFTYGQAKWVTVSNTIGNAFRDGTAKGIMLGKGPTSSKTYYGYFAGNGQTGEMQLRITYTK